MKELEKQNLIVDKLIDNGWNIVDYRCGGRNTIRAKKSYADIEISTEECSCHGGRMWIHNKHTESSVEISYPLYREELGITDSESELLYIIEHEMLDKIEGLNHYVYKLATINQYGKNYDGTTKENVEYFSNMKSLFQRVTKTIDDNNDIFTIDEKGVIYQPPNKNIYEITKRIKNPNNEDYLRDKRMWFKTERYDRKSEKEEFKLESTYEKYVDIFNKH